MLLWQLLIEYMVHNYEENELFLFYLRISYHAYQNCE